MIPLIIIVIAVLAGGALFIFLKYRSERNQAKKAEAKKKSADSSNSAKSSKAAGATEEHEDVPDSGELTKGSGDWWLLNPKSGFPLEVKVSDPDIARELKKTLDWSYTVSKSGAVRKVKELLSTHGIVCKQVEEYISAYKATFLANVEASKAASPSMPSSTAVSALQTKVINEFEIRPFCDISVLLTGHQETNSAEEDIKASLEERFGAKLTGFYLSKKAGIHSVKQGHPERKAFEKLAEVKLAESGSLADPKKLLKTLSLENMTKLVEDLTYPDFGNRKEAYKVISELPDLKQRLKNVIDYRSIFEILPPPDAPSAAPPVSDKLKGKYEMEVAKLLTNTYLSGGNALSDFEGYKGSSYSIIKGWEIIASKDCCTYCKQEAARKHEKKDFPKTPLHLGCRCKVITLL